jgi:hypothetical protein
MAGKYAQKILFFFCARVATTTKRRIRITVR